MDNKIPLSAIEERLAKLERKVFCHTEGGEQIKCFDTLMTIQNRLQSAVTGREKITTVFSKLDDLEKYLRPLFKDNIILPDSSKLNMVLLEEDRIRSVVDSLQTVKDLQQFMDSEHIKAVPSLYSKLCAISQVQLEQEESISCLSQDTRNLIADYDNIIMSLSKQFILWDGIVTELENKKNLQNKPR